MQFGRSSERISRQIEQLEFRLEELETGEAEDDRPPAAEDRPAPIRERTRPKRKPLPDHLPRQEVVHQPDGRWRLHLPRMRQRHGQARRGRDRGAGLRARTLPGHSSRSAEICLRRCDAITQAPAPAMPTPRGRATPGTLAHLLVAKYCDHLPLYRQSEIYAREGLELDRSTLCDWVGQAAWLLDPVVDGIRRHVFAAEKIHGDDTTVPVLAPGLGRTRTGRLWVYVRDDRPFCGAAPPAAAYFYSPDRGGEHPATHMAGFNGFLQADGYAGSRRCTIRAADPSSRQHLDHRSGMLGALPPEVLRCVGSTKSPVAKEALDRIAAIYVIETKAQFARQPSGWNTASRDRAAARCVLRPGPTNRAPSCRRSRHWPRRSATRSSGARHSRASSPMDVLRPITTSPRTPCVASHWDGMRWTRKIGQEVKLGLLLRRTDLNDGQTEAVFGGIQGEGCS